MREKKLEYGVAHKAWQAVVGCSPTMPCAKRCWARRTVARIVECQEEAHPERAAFFQQALTADGQQWSSVVRLDEAHLFDPLRWRKPAVIATGFHGDWGRLADGDKLRILGVMARCPWHTFMPLTKCPADVAAFAERWADTKEADYEPKLARGPQAVRAAHTCGRAHLFADMLEAMGKPPAGCAYPTYDWMEGMCRWPNAFPNVSIGCSVMYQSGDFGADQMREPMRRLSELDWRTHVWYEPALGPVDWTGWEFVERIIYGGESGAGARPNDLQWARNTLDFCLEHGIKFVMKQAGAWPYIEHGSMSFGGGRDYMRLKSRKGDDLSELPLDLRVRELPEVAHA